MKRTGACANLVFQALPRANTLTELLLRESKDGDVEEFARCEVLFGGPANPDTAWVVALSTLPWRDGTAVLSAAPCLSARTA